MTKQTELLIIGASGFLGHHFCALASKHRLSFTATYHSGHAAMRGYSSCQLDITSKEEVERALCHLNPIAVINMAAINPGGPQELMNPVNAQAAGDLAQMAYRYGSHFIHVSSDCVHDGKTAPYDDDTPPSPINIYGQSKALGEERVRQNHPTATIIRTSLIYHLDQIDRGTAGFMKRLEHGNLALFEDVIRQPIHAETLCHAILKLVSTPYAGILNIAGSQPMSRAAFGKRLLDYWNYDYGERLTTALASDLAPTMPLDLRLNLHKATSLLNMDFPSVEEMVERMQAHP